MSKLEQIWRQSFRVADTRPIWEWAHDHIKFGATSPYPGYFNIDNVPWTRRIYEAWQDPKVRRITVSGCPQKSGKTVAAQVSMAWQAVNDPAPMGYYADNDGKAKRFADTRWKEMQGNCAVLAQKIRSDVKQRTIFKDGTFLLLLGAESEANRQSDTLRVIIKDEAWRYKAGHGLEIDNRKEAFELTKDWKILELGTGGILGHEFANNFYNGTLEQWEVPCPHCGGYHDYRWNVNDGGVFRWEEKYYDDSEVLDINATLDTVHIECPHCHSQIRYDAGQRKQLNEKGRWRATNPEADPENVSIQIPAFVPGADWRDMVKKWIKIGKGHNVGKREALKHFIMMDLAEIWEDRPIIEKRELPHGDYTRQDMLDGKWDREITRLATIDYQRGRDDDREHLWFVVRAYAQNGDSRLVDCGRVNEFTELKERLDECGVEEPPEGYDHFSRTLIDCAFRPSIVFENCLRFRWVGIRGEDRDTSNRGGQFQHLVRYSRKAQPVKVWKNYSEIKYQEVGVGRTQGLRGVAPWRSINNQGCEDILHELRTGRSLIWEVPSDIEEFCPDYADQMNSHIKINVSKDEAKPVYKWVLAGDSRKYPDHLYDCEKYQVGAALIAEFFEDISTAD